jgi:hypothetical protein
LEAIHQSLDTHRPVVLQVPSLVGA